MYIVTPTYYIYIYMLVGVLWTWSEDTTGLEMHASFWLKEWVSLHHHLKNWHCKNLHCQNREWTQASSPMWGVCEWMKIAGRFVQQTSWRLLQWAKVRTWSFFISFWVSYHSLACSSFLSCDFPRFYPYSTVVYRWMQTAMPSSFVCIIFQNAWIFIILWCVFFTF